MRLMHIALGGCLSAAPIRYGVTEDTGGHIAYVLGAAAAQARRAEIRDVAIVTRAFDAPEIGPGFDRAQEVLPGGCRILRLATGRRDYLEKDALEAEIPALCRAFLDLLRRCERPDVIHAHFADAAVLARAAERAFGIPWLFSAHSLGRDKDARAGCAALRRRIRRESQAIRGATAIIASSRDEAERQIAAYDPDAAGRTHRINPGTDLLPDRGTAAARRLIAPFLRDPERPIVLAIARPVAKKNLAALIDAYAGSPDLRARANLVVVAGQRAGLTGGGGPAAGVLADLFDRVDRNDLWGAVALPRRHGHEDVRSLYALAADGGVFVNPALSEPFGLTVVEAAQAGVPVVATRNGGPADILAQVGGGRLVDPTAPDEIAAACLDALADPRRPARAETARAAARAAFSWDRWAEEVAAVCAGLRRPAPVPHRAARLLASDMDGTLTGDRAAAARFARHLERTPDLAFAVATGRPVSEARRVLATWGLPLPRILIAAVGSEIWRLDRGGAYRLDRAYAQAIDADWPRAAILRALAAAGLRPQAAYEQRRWKLGYLGGADAGARARAALDAAGLHARVIASHARFVDVVPAAAGKAAAVAHVARGLCLTLDACIAAGDSGNDADMLTACGAAVLPANALDELADIAGPGLYRSSLPHAAGVLDGLARLGQNGLGPTPLPLAAE
ncbi:HAD-IIB family hydrolase [Rhodobacteraceae bacterium CCMM004]|nr:HAD-IIB family hydrolase [Rhodobacteraceae bacterium CCMM004]